MARENKRKRDVKRFGRPERIFDLIDSCQWGMPVWYRGPKDSDLVRVSERVISGIKRHAPKCINFLARNVSDYYYLHAPQKYRSFVEDYPQPVPPYEYMFVELGSHQVLDSNWPSCGWLFITLQGDDVSTCIRPDKIFDGDGPNTEAIESGNADRVVSATGMLRRSGDGVIVPVCRFSYVLDGQGAMMANPRLTALGADFQGQMMEDIWKVCCCLFSPALMALSFMNCKNVEVRQEPPEKRINVSRVKAGLKPFARFNTINIEAMKEVLRTEGDVESNGPQKAMHICRGHFKTWTSSYMGRPLDKPVTYWAPSHVKGSAKHGVVISDYDVKAPK